MISNLACGLNNTVLIDPNIWSKFDDALSIKEVNSVGIEDAYLSEKAMVIFWRKNRGKNQHETSLNSIFKLHERSPLLLQV